MSAILDSFRRWGYLEADLDPFGRLAPHPHESLRREGPEADHGRRVYCGSLGIEFMHLPDPVRCRWIQERMEGGEEEPDRRWILERLLAADTFENMLHTRYVGNKRFSLEGSMTLIPLLGEALESAAAQGANEAVLAMSHRGRLEVMATILGKPPSSLFARFEDVDPRSVLGGGDVKYHLGANGDYLTRGGEAVRIALVPNPSHLEAVTPIAMGLARGRQVRIGPEGRRRLLPITVHGDAAFAGQGILSETLNLAELAGYTVGGTIHVIVNNMIGFTATPPSLHSSRFASDAAKRLSVPILHVNGEEPEAVVRAARLAVEYRYAFSSDVVIDLIGYRLYGHSEVDDPTITQPVLYRKIAERPPVWRSYAEAIGVGEEELDRIRAGEQARLDEERDRAREFLAMPTLRRPSDYWAAYMGGPYQPAFEVETSVAADRLAGIAEVLGRPPEGFRVHTKVARLLEQRIEMGRGERPVDWGMAESLAFGSLLLEGVPIRLTGQDSRRGTFNHRHAALIDGETEEEYVPLAHLDPRQARFSLYDSPLSEAAVLGFEYGFSRELPEALTVWEAQFGDFANGAQIILDQFIAAAEDKWKLLSGLVVLLPHGFEGQGPEHSSARLERYLQLAAEDNFQVCQPSTAAQCFHMLRRQALRRWRKPLVVMTPKSLLRDPRACSALTDFSTGRFQPVLRDRDLRDVRRVIVCSGKVGHDLVAERERRKDPSVAIVFLEQLYPFPEKALGEALDRYRRTREIVWVQEEPANMGALFFVVPRLQAVVGGRPVRTVKRSASASPATGSPKAHAMEQRALLDLAFSR